MKITEQWCKDTLGAVAPAGPLPKDYTAVELACHWVYHNIENPQQWFEAQVVAPHRRYVEKRRKEYGAVRQPYHLMLDIWNKGEYGKPSKGYNGDGNLLQKMYDCLSVPDFDRDGLPQATHIKSLWDHYVCACPEMLSLQFRRGMFETAVRHYISQGARSWLDLGCGNGSYTQYAYDTMSKALGEACGPIVGVDNDLQTDRLGPLFMKMNVLRELPVGPFDVVYSGGLFDYFNDKIFRYMLDRICELKPKFIMIGNIDQTPHTKSFMGCMDWKLVDRARFDLLELTMNKFGASQVSVETDITGCQHFLKIKL